jgi:hypothetical protein
MNPAGHPSTVAGRALAIGGWECPSAQIADEQDAASRQTSRHPHFLPRAQHELDRSRSIRLAASCRVTGFRQRRSYLPQRTLAALGPCPS